MLDSDGHFLLFSALLAACAPPPRGSAPGPEHPALPLEHNAVEAGFDREVAPELQVFVILPFGHSERLADQERSVGLARRLGQPHLGHAEHHCDIVRRFGRFPHRNAILGRTSTDAERHFLENGGYQG
jgi:uncharacterized protein (DUF924 family)